MRLLPLYNGDGLLPEMVCLSGAFFMSAGIGIYAYTDNEGEKKLLTTDANFSLPSLCAQNT